MSENLEMQSLAGLASRKGAPARTEPGDARSVSGQREDARRTGFDGLLKTFLGQEKPGNAGNAGGNASAGQAAQNPNADGTRSKTKANGRKKGGAGGGKNANSAEKAVSRMPAKEKDGLRRALEKTVPGDRAVAAGTAAGSAAPEAAADAIPVDPEVAAAAEEAARIIWSILYPGAGTLPETFEVAPKMGDAIASLAEMLAGAAQAGGLSGMGVPGLGSGDVEGAMATANASAEMNIDAVLAALEDLLDGMPREALESALAKAAETLGMASEQGADEGFAEIAAALGMEIVESETENADAGVMLDELKKSIPSAEVIRPPEETTGIAGQIDHVDRADGIVDAALAVDVEHTANVLPPDSLAHTGGIEEPDGDRSHAVELPVDGGHAADKTGDAGTVRQKPAVHTAESAGNIAARAEIVDLFKQFVAEKYPDGMPSESAGADAAMEPELIEDVLASFANWIAETSNSKEAKRLASSPDSLALALADALTPADNEADVDAANTFFAFSENLESVLQKSGIKNSSENDGFIAGSDASGAGKTGSGAAGSSLLKTADDGPGSAVAVAPSAIGANAAVQPAQPAQPLQTASSMLDRLENIERLADAFRMANRNGVKNLTLQLSPAELGKVTLRVEARDGVVSAYLRVEKPETVAELTSSLQQLRENLKAQGIELGQLDIRQYNQGQAMADGGQKHGRNHEADPDADADADGSGTRRGTDAADAESIEQPAGGTGGAGPGRLNLFA